MIYFGCMKFVGVDMRGKYIKIVIPRISEVFQHVLKTHCGMYECMDFIPKFLRWWVTKLAGWRYSSVEPLFGIWNHSMEHELRIHQGAAHWGKDPWHLYCGLISELHIGVKANGECIEYPSLNCTLRESSMVHELKILQWFAHLRKGQRTLDD